MKAPNIPSHLLPGAAFWRRVGFILVVLQLAVSLCQAGGSVVAWGRDNASQTEVPGGLVNVIAVAGGDAHSLALNSDGTVVGWGFNLNGQATPPAGLSNVVAIAAGNSYSMALKSDGTVKVWGLQSDPPAGLSNVVAIAAGWTHALALKSDGSVVAWGDNTFGQTNVPAGLSAVVAIAAGNNDSLALQSGGKVVAWGDNAYGKAQIPVGLNNVTAIAAGQDHCLALKADGTVTAWGRDDFGQATVPVGLSNVVAISAGALHCLVLRVDGTLAAWGDNVYNQSVVNPTQAGYFSISAGGYHNLGVRSFGLPTILTQPQTQTVGTFSTVNFRVTVVGTPPLAFQWKKDGTSLAGATIPTLTLPSVQTNDGGVYTVVISNALGVVSSTGAVLSVASVPPTISIQPLDQSAFCGESATFQITATGTEPLSYQWLFQGKPIGSATNSALPLPAVTTNQAGAYSVVLTNMYGGLTSAVAHLTVVLEPPLITSPLTASGKQGQPFSYTITAKHNPTLFAFLYLPAGLALDPVSGIISGIPQENGGFGSIITAINDCASASATLVLNIAPSIPQITSVSTASGSQGLPFVYRITATESPTVFGAQNLPAALSVDPTTGIVSGIPSYAGDFDSTIFASNAWGGATAPLHFTFAANQPVSQLSIANVTYSYTSPYLLNFQFSLRDNNDPTMGNAVVVDPSQLLATGFEDDEMVSSNETSIILHRGSAKVTKTYLVLDFTESIASLVNGDSNSNGISDAVDSMVSGAQSFVNQQPSTTQIGVYEFHREDRSPTNVLKLTTDKVLLNNTIAGIWTNYVKGFSAGSRCWDALVAAIKDLGANNPDEQHFVVFVSDGRDESSLSTTNDVIKAATNANVAIYCVGFGADLDAPTLQAVTGATAGRYYTATNSADVALQFANIAKDFNGQYVLRWATLKRAPKLFMPSFTISYLGLTATSPTNPWYVDTNNPIIDTNAMPPTTNYNNVTNFIIAYYTNKNTAGDVTVGSLRLVPNADVHPSGWTLRTAYIPRYVRQIRLHYRANWPVTTIFDATNSGDLFAGWTLVQTNDGSGGTWALLSSTNPPDIETSLRFADFGDVLNFNFRDTINSTSNVFSVLAVDNTLYTNTGGQSFAFDTNTLAFITAYPVLTNGTPVPWLIAYGITTNWQAAEFIDTDGDGMLNWQEYQANTDPTDAKSKFVIRSVAPGSDGRNQITFSTALNRTYRVDSSTDLITWQTVQDGIAGSGTDETVSDPALQLGAPEIFYRVRVY